LTSQTIDVGCDLLDIINYLRQLKNPYRIVITDG